MIIGYARVSTEDQDNRAQLAELKAAGCELVFEDKASGSRRDRPNLTRALARAGQGDTLLVVRIDRLARSLSHLLELVETLRAKGCAFRSIRDPIDTTSAQGVLMMQMLGAFAEFERSLIRERTKAGLAVARAAGRHAGNPKMIARDPVACLSLSDTFKGRYLSELKRGAGSWLPIVESYRPFRSWDYVTRMVNQHSGAGRSFTRRTLVKACKALVAEGLIDPRVLERAHRQAKDSEVALLVADKLKTQPGITIGELAHWLSVDLARPAPRGGLKWSSVAVEREIEYARKLGKLPGVSVREVYNGSSRRHNQPDTRTA